MVAPTALALPFDFGCVAAPDRRWLKRAAREIRVRARRVSADLLAMGRLLLLAERRLKASGRWLAWCKAEVEFSQTHIDRLKACARVFGRLPPEVANRIEPTAMYSLSEAGVPQSFREFVVQEVQKDPARVVGAKEVQDLLADHRDKTRPPASLALAVSKDPPRAEVEADDVHAADNWRLLVRTLAPGVSLHLSCTADAETGDQTVLLTRLGDGPRPASLARTTLEQCLVELTAEVRKKKCNGACQLVKPLAEFSKRKDQPDGRNRYCLMCERARVKLASEKKKLRKAAARVRVTGAV